MLAALMAGADVCYPQIGTVMFGLHPDGTETPAAMDLVRLAIPRRTYTQSHMDYVIEVVLGAELPAVRRRTQRQAYHQ